MSKLKFFGCIMTAAVFALGLASCEKENFNTIVDPEVNVPPITIPGVDIETELPDYNPGDAVISIQPTVWAFIDGKVDNVTALATIKFNGVEKKTYNASSATGFEAMTIKITASYDATVGTESKTLTAEMSLEIPALGAGKLAIFTPTLIMSAKSPSTGDEGGEGEGGGTVIVPGADGVDYAYVLGEPTITTATSDDSFQIKNESNYYYFFYDAVSENTYKKKIDWIADSPNHQAGVDALEQANPSFVDVFVNEEIRVPEGFYVYSKSVTQINVKVHQTISTFPIYAYPASRSLTEVGRLIVTDYLYEYKDHVNLELDGVSHGHGQGHGHGHGHGHGNENAGGGIVSPM